MWEPSLATSLCQAWKARCITSASLSPYCIRRIATTVFIQGVASYPSTNAGGWVLQAHAQELIESTFPTKAMWMFVASCVCSPVVRLKANICSKHGRLWLDLLWCLPQEHAHTQNVKFETLRSPCGCYQSRCLQQKEN